VPGFCNSKIGETTWWSSNRTCLVLLQEAQKVIDMWKKYPADEFVPLMKHMFEYSIRAVLFTLYGLSANDDQQLIRTIHASYDVVSFYCLFSSKRDSFCTL